MDRKRSRSRLFLGGGEIASEPRGSHRLRASRCRATAQRLGQADGEAARARATARGDERRSVRRVLASMLKVGSVLVRRGRDQRFAASVRASGGERRAPTSRSGDRAGVPASTLEVASVRVVAHGPKRQVARGCCPGDEAANASRRPDAAVRGIGPRAASSCRGMSPTRLPSRSRRVCHRVLAAEVLRRDARSAGPTVEYGGLDVLRLKSRGMVQSRCRRHTPGHAGLLGNARPRQGLDESLAGARPSRAARPREEPQRSARGAA
jgi:hypothetical protein